MRYQIQVVMMGCFFAAMVMPGCSLIDEPSVQERSTRASAEESTPEWTTRHSADGPADSPTPEATTARVVAGCVRAADCPPLDHAARWCTSDGRCQYSCHPGYGDANGEEPADGCECQRRNAGIEQCDRHDDDCDGVVDNLFAGGALASGPRLTCVTSRAGELHCMGEGPAAIDAGIDEPGLYSLSTGGRHGCALDEQGRVYCWGDNGYGQSAPTEAARVERPQRMGLGTGFVDVAAGRYHSCALSAAGEVWCWGRNDYGQTGDGTVVQSRRPHKIAADLEFVDVEAGDFHTCALTAAGKALCWGANFLGQTAQADVSAVNVPSPVDIDEALSQLSLGANHSCALTPTGRSYCWGDNEDGQLGDDSRESRARPRALDVAPEFVSLSAGGAHTCGLTNAGRLFCWGDNAAGQLGLSEPAAYALIPRPFVEPMHFASVAAGGAHTCAMSLDGRLYCWGQGRQGQLGGGSEQSSRRPARAECAAP